MYDFRFPRFGQVWLLALVLSLALNIANGNDILPRRN